MNPGGPRSEVTMQLEEDRQVETTFSPELEKELWEHPGKWAAIVGDDLVAVGDTLIEVIKQARDAGHLEPMLYKVPSEGASYFF